MRAWLVVLVTLAAALLCAPARAQGSVGLWVVDGKGRVLRARDATASMQRTPPTREPVDPTAPHGDGDALRYLVVAPIDAIPSLVEIHSLGGDGRRLGSLRDVALQSVPCPKIVKAARGVSCAVTPAVRAVADDVDAMHPLVRHRSLLAELGGALIVHAGGQADAARELGRVRVAGPRHSALGPLERFRARLRFVMVRLAPSGALPFGGDRESAVETARDSLERANALWAACGISFGPSSELMLSIVDPPPPHLLAIGCDHGLPATGGKIELEVDKKPLSIPLRPGMLPSEAARRVAAGLRKLGFDPRISDNPRMGAGAFGASDISVRRRDGSLASLALPASGRLSSDATLLACIGAVSLEDGLQHFGDVDSAVGTVEERALVKAFDDGDATTIDVYVVPGFARGGRIGESFIGTDGSSIRNVVVIDRAGIRSGRASFTLAHELGHVLLDDPGHPDDFGVDTPTRLMDADASDPTAFGPRRLEIDECERAVRQSGNGALVELLTPWALEPLDATPRRRQTGAKAGE
jgi:hypothetical protein